MRARRCTVVEVVVSVLTALYVKCLRTLPSFDSQAAYEVVRLSMALWVKTNQNKNQKSGSV